MPKIGIRPAIDGRLGGVRESLEKQTMEMAKSAANLISSSLHHPNGMRVDGVIADTCIGGVAEAAACAEKFARSGVGVSITVTPCWCYGSETMDRKPMIPKAVWGFNGTEPPGAVYLAAVLASHSKKGIPAFSIYGHEVQDDGDKLIPADVQEKILRFIRAGLAVALMRGKSFLGVGGVSMGIAGSIVDQPFFEDYPGMRVETIDMTEFLRRMEKGIYDPAEYKKALKWVKTNCSEGKDYNSPKTVRSRRQLDSEWEKSVKMALMARDLLVGNPKLAEMGFGEEAHGHNAIALGFQGQRQWTDYQLNGDFLEAILNTSIDWNGPRAPYIVATENDCLNGASMLFGYLLTNTAQIFADVRTYWSPESEACFWPPPRAPRGQRHFASHKLRPCRTRWHRPAGTRRPASNETVLGNHQGRGKKRSRRDDMASIHHRVFPRWRLEHTLSHTRRNARHHVSVESHQGSRRGIADRRRLDGGFAGKSPRHIGPAHKSDVADDVVCANPHRYRSIPRCLFRNEQLGCETRCHQLWPYRCGFDFTGLHAAHPGLHAQRGGGEGIPSKQLGGFRHGGPRRGGLSSMRKLWPALRKITSNLC